MKKKPVIEKVRCAACRHFKRDTSGSSRNVVTGEYFIGSCPFGHGDGVEGRVMADVKRVCKDYDSNE